MALLGDGAFVADAAELAGLEREAAADAAGVLTEAGIFRSDERLRFVHALMRDAINQDTPASARLERHARAARVLAQHGRDPDLVAAHVLLSAPRADGWAVERLRDAARLAVARGAPDAAVPLLCRALEEPPPEELRVWVLFELGLAEAALQRPEAVEHLVGARDGLAPGAERAAVGLVLARVLMHAGRLSEVYETVRDARVGLDEAGRELALALDATAVNAGSVDPGARELIAERLDELAGVQGITPGERAALASVAFARAISADPAAEVLELVERAIGSSEWGFAAAADTFAPVLLVTVLHWSSRITRAVELATALIDEARSIGSPMLFAEASTARALAHWRGGMLAEAEADARQALATTGSPFESSLATHALIGVLTDRGDLQAAASVAEAFRFPPELPSNAMRAVVECSHGQLELALGRHEQAISRLTAAGAVLDAVRTVNPAGGEWRQPLALALAALGRREEAREVLGPALVAARRSQGAYELGSTLRAAALVEQPVGVELLHEALAVLEASEIRLHRARVLVDLGTALRRQRHRREAREPLAEGMELAHECGATALVERARTELLAAGARPRRIERTGADALTASELRVARLARDGLSNREIAQQLFVSPRTVEAQLRNTYLKLEVGSRDELATALGAETKLK